MGQLLLLSSPSVQALRLGVSSFRLARAQRGRSPPRMQPLHPDWRTWPAPISQ